MILHCDLDLEDSKTIFLEDNQAYNDASPYQVWSKKVWRFERYLDKRSIQFRNFAVTWTFNTKIQFLHKNLWLMS